MTELAAREPEAVPLPAARLWWRCDPAEAAPEGADTSGPLVGQADLVEVARVALSAPSPGSHAFLAGPTGCGRRTAVAALVAGGLPRAWPRRDLVLVPRSARPAEAAVEVLPAGAGAAAVAASGADGRPRSRLLVASSPEGPPPVLVEAMPTWERLLGSVAAPDDDPTPWDFVRPGALLRADGGVVVLDADAAAAEPGLWRELCRALAAGALHLRPPPLASAARSVAIDPVPLHCTVVAVGSPALLQDLRARGPARAAFPLRVDAWRDLPRTPEVVGAVLDAAVRMARDAGSLPLARAAAAPLVEELSAAAGGRERVSARLGRMGEWLLEADAVARTRGAPEVASADVEEALRRVRARSRTRYERVQDRIARGLTLMDLDGGRVGVVNALLVWTGEEAAYGAPARVTATAAVGREGVLNLERESKLSGSTFDKGVLILGGLLRSRFASASPLSLVASLCVEQNYGRIDGDSATLAEWIALLSELSAAPVRQDLAVTGSLNQKGEVQPIGRVNEKIEGFFDACAHAGLTGTQGVVIPAANAADLILPEEVVRACAEGRFHVYTVGHADAAVSLMTGRPAGALGARGRYPPGSVHAAAAARLARMAARLHPQRKDRAARAPARKAKAAPVPVPAGERGSTT